MGHRDLAAMTMADAPQKRSRRGAGVIDRRVSHISYGARRALIDVSFTVAPASFTALLGLNSAGKGILFSRLTRLFGIQAGRVSISGHDIDRELSEALRLLGVAFQSHALDLDLSVKQNLLYHTGLHGIGRHEASPAASRCSHGSALPTAGGKVRHLGRPDAKARNRPRAFAPAAPPLAICYLAVLPALILSGLMMGSLGMLISSGVK